MLFGGVGDACFLVWVELELEGWDVDVGGCGVCEGVVVLLFFGFDFVLLLDVFWYGDVVVVGPFNNVGE